MIKPIEWVKRNKLAAVLSIAVVYLITQNSYHQDFGLALNNSRSSPQVFPEMVSDMAIDNSGTYSPGVALRMPGFPSKEAAPTSQADRMVVQDTFISLLVNDVSDAITNLKAIAVKSGGFMVNSYLAQPEGAASGSITIRVPIDYLDQTLTAIKAAGIKVVSENVSGRDVTDEYVDIESRLSSLNTTKTKYESILNEAKSVSQIMEVQRELINLQTEIDSLKGRQLYLSQSAKLSKITISLSTDELALPYTPDESWRPAVIFKEATRSLIGSLRDVGTAIIWVLVYAPVWLAILAGLFVYRHTKKTKKLNP